MKVLLILASLSLCRAAVVIQTLKNPEDYGASLQFNNQDTFGNYNFGYNEGHLSGGSFRRETGDAFGNKIGSYGLRDADGRLRIVTYVADANGFRADVKTNEPGVEPQDPASTTINKPILVAGGKPGQLVAAPAAPVAVAPVATVPLPPPSLPVQQVVKASPYVSAPVAQPAVPVAQYVNSVVPYSPRYQDYKALPPAQAYYGSPYNGNIVGAQALQNYVAVAPPAYALPYGPYGVKSLPSYQPLGYS